jgi:hypothetical protein
MQSRTELGPSRGSNEMTNSKLVDIGLRWIALGGLGHVRTYRIPLFRILYSVFLILAPRLCFLVFNSGFWIPALISCFRLQASRFLLLDAGFLLLDAGC